MKTSTTTTPTPFYRRTYPDDSEAEQRRDATTPKYYDRMMLQHFKEGSPCELCSDPIAMAITVQVHRRYKEKRINTCIMRDERFPVLEFYVCKNHATAAAFYQLAITDWPASPHYMVLGSCAVPTDGKNPGPFVCASCEKPIEKSAYGDSCRICNRFICEDLACWRVYEHYARICFKCIQNGTCTCDGPITKDDMMPGTDLEKYRYCYRHSLIFADKKEQQDFIARFLKKDLADEKRQEKEPKEDQ